MISYKDVLNDKEVLEIIRKIDDRFYMIGVLIVC